TVTAGAATAAAPLGIDTLALAPQLKILALLTLLTLLPAIVLTMTSFTRVVVVLGFVRQGLGTQQSPPTPVIIGIGIFLTMFIMAPVASAIARDAYEPFTAGRITQSQAIDRAIAPMRTFMLRQTREADLAMFFDATNTPAPRTEEEVPFQIAVPAFIVSELTTAFQMGAMVLLPFLVIDLAVSSVLMSMGMMMMTPATASLPLKLLVFVTADGWHMLVGSLLRSFQ
ncbi:MAG: flagellar type III secretion system pore protein FliP, partial [Deltaproteobacteria bacterium]